MADCPHGVPVPEGIPSSRVCTLCRGDKQSSDGQGWGTPPWYVSSAQLAVRSNYAQVFIFGTDKIESGAPKGSDCKTLLPYRKRTCDPKQRKRYEMQIAKKGDE
jgi:hypothetical protein